MTKARDEEFMRRALVLAERGWGHTSPNPMVGAVVVRANEIVGEGWHERYGGPHAEVIALASAGERAEGATVYVNLEPCRHTGQTPPCTDALIAARVARVVAATRDPGVDSGGGAEKLRAAGIDVELGVLEAEARELNAPFFHGFASDRPWVTLKLALSIDGAIADSERGRAWLTNEDSRAEVHRIRANVDAIAVGATTYATDHPELTVRGADPATRRSHPGGLRSRWQAIRGSNVRSRGIKRHLFREGCGPAGVAPRPQNARDSIAPGRGRGVNCLGVPRR